MPPLPTITDVFRVTLNWNTAHGVTPRNVMHFFAPSKNEQDIATAWDANDQTHMWDPVQQDWAFDSLDILKLDGSSATQTLSVAAEGSLTSGDWIQGQACILFMKTAQRGSRGRGRLFLGPLAETKLTNGLVVPGASFLTDWGTFFAGMAGDGVFPGVASYSHADFHVLTSHGFQFVPGSVRRRNDQLR